MQTYRDNARTTHLHLFELVQQQAAEFCRLTIPRFENAHNRYREIGDGLPVLGLMYLPASKYDDQYFQDFGLRLQADAPHKFSWPDFLFYDAAVGKKDFTTLLTFHHAESHATYDYVIGDAGNIYVDEAGLSYFRRHLIFLKPDVLVIADHVLAKEHSEFEWLLQLNEIAEVDLRPAGIEVIKNGVPFWVLPKYPGNTDIELHRRHLEANDVHGSPGRDSGILKTVSIKTSGHDFMYLVVLAIDKPGSMAMPSVRFDKQNLLIEHNGRGRQLRFDASAGSDAPSWKIVR